MLNIIDVMDSYEQRFDIAFSLKHEQTYCLQVQSRPVFVIRPYPSDQVPLFSQKVISITDANPSLRHRIYFADAPRQKFHVLDMNASEKQWLLALAAAEARRYCLFFKYQHRLIAEVLLMPEYEYYQTLEQEKHQAEILRVQQEKINLPPQAADGYIGSQQAIEQAKKQKFVGWQKISDQGLVIPNSHTEWAAVKEIKRRLMWAVNHPKYPQLTMSSRSFVSIKGAYAYMQRANEVKWCGYQDWRLPTVDELMGLMTQHEEMPSELIHIHPLRLIKEKEKRDKQMAQDIQYHCHTFGVSKKLLPTFNHLKQQYKQQSDAAIAHHRLQQTLLAEQSLYAEQPTSVCLRADLFNDIPHNKQDGHRRVDSYDVWTSTIGLSSKGQQRAGTVNFSQNIDQRVSFSLRSAYVRLVRSY